MYNQYKEDCCICDSDNTIIKIDNSQTFTDGVSFLFPFVYIHCNECGFEFGNRALTSLNASNRNIAQNLAMKYTHSLASLKIDINYPNVELGVGMYTQKKAAHPQRGYKSLSNTTSTLIVQENTSRALENKESFSETIVKVIGNGFFKRGYAQ